MVDLAQVGMGFIAVGGLVAGGFATAMWRDAVAEAERMRREYLSLLERKVTPVQLTEADIVQPHVMCGACGMSAPLEADGFTISEHNCDTRDLFSDHGLRSDQR